MRAAVIAGPGEVALTEAPIPDPGPGQVLVALDGCGVCGSDLAVWEGRPWFEYPREPGAPGHEGWGRVVARGQGVRGLELDTPVAALSYHADAEFDLAEADAVVALPAQLAGQPFPGEALGCAMNVARRCEFTAGQTVAVVGVGFLGGVLVALAASAGARVIAISRRTFALEIATRMGADRAIALDGDALAEVEELTGGGLCDTVLEVTGRQGPLDLCGQLAKVRGRLVIAGFHQDGSRQVDMQLWNWRGLDVINAHERDPAVYIRGIREAAGRIAAGRLDPSPLYTHQFPLERLGEALATAAERPDGFLKALVRP